MKSKPIGALFGVLALVVILAIAQPAFAATGQVTINKGAGNTAGKCTATSCFNPNVVNINVGDTVTWTNADSVPHTASYDDGNLSDSSVGSVWDSSMIKAGATYTSPAFTTAGTFSYFCEVHPWMAGQVIVGAAGAMSHSGSGNTGTSNMTGMTGNQKVPEFGPVASLVLVFAIISVVIFTSKARGFLKL